MRLEMVRFLESMQGFLCWFSCVWLLLLPGMPGLAAGDDYEYRTQDFTTAFINITYTDPKTGLRQTENREIGRFGTNTVDDVNGVLSLARTVENKTDGCLRLNRNVPKPEPWIAMVRRGNCNFNVKIRNAAIRLNASAVVVFNDKAEENLVVMEHQERRVVAVFMSKVDGDRIAALLENGTEVHMYISVGTRTTYRYASINRTSVLFVSISFIVLMVISLAWLVFYYVQRFRYVHAKDRLQRRLLSAAKKALTKIPMKTIKPGDKEASASFDSCAVCIDGFKASEVVRTLPCKHVFHKACVDPWLLDQRTCPMCKTDILKACGLQVLDGEDLACELGTNSTPDDPTVEDDSNNANSLILEELVHPHQCSSTIVITADNATIGDVTNFDVGTDPHRVTTDSTTAAAGTSGIASNKVAPMPMDETATDGENLAQNNTTHNLLVVKLPSTTTTEIPKMQEDSPVI